MDGQIPLSQLDAATDDRVLLRQAIRGVDDASNALALLADDELTTGRIGDAEWALKDALNRVQLLKRGVETEEPRQMRLSASTEEE